MAQDQTDLLRLARRLGELERAAADAKNKQIALVEKGNQVRDLIFANLAATGSPAEREAELVRLLAQASERPRLQVKTRKDKQHRTAVS